MPSHCCRMIEACLSIVPCHDLTYISIEDDTATAPAQGQSTHWTGVLEENRAGTRGSGADRRPPARRATLDFDLALVPSILVTWD